MAAPIKQSVLFTLFFFSGCAALMYQVIWQRMLFTLYGVDLESITVIVSVFMFGLGVGAVWGGIIADKMLTKLLKAYVIIELCVASFGFFSPYIIEKMGATILGYNEFVTALSSFAILAIPTILMGATLPILVTHVYSFDKNIGRSIGGLYFANTLGGALGAFLAGIILLYFIDIIGIIHIAAGINLLIAVIALFAFKRNK